MKNTLSEVAEFGMFLIFVGVMGWMILSQITISENLTAISASGGAILASVTAGFRWLEKRHERRSLVPHPLEGKVFPAE